MTADASYQEIMNRTDISVITRLYMSFTTTEVFVRAEETVPTRLELHSYRC